MPLPLLLPLPTTHLPLSTKLSLYKFDLLCIEIFQSCLVVEKVATTVKKMKFLGQVLMLLFWREKFSKIVGSPYYMAPKVLKRNYVMWGSSILSRCCLSIAI
ncbi:Calcium-dependent protein kinase 13 [Camellia lanceoleosa]|uniref:Calcium-dependent protein kinase 13 n=1 Tax=Camellia lanceoleosa TaxID=1840588 RepID=A0ACC0FPF7_9ERIC|nr:Calcium-dependent protein kinase 13 [Camellia lanceoleosa]